MIRFHRDRWWSSVIVFFGGVIPLLIKPAAFYLAYLSSAYLFCSYQYDVELLEASGGRHILTGCVSFLLIFRLHQANQRYRAGLDLTAEMFSHLNLLMTMTVSYLNGSHERPLDLNGTALGADPVKQDTYAELALCVKVHAVRLILAFAVAFKLHCHMAGVMEKGSEIPKEIMVHIIFDYLRLKGLLYSKEQTYLDDSCSVFEESIENIVGLCTCCCTSPCSCCGSSGGSEPNVKYYCDLNKHRSAEESRHKQPFFQNHTDNEQTPSHSRSVSNQSVDGNGKPTSQTNGPVPLVIMQLLRGALYQAVNQPWGYPERTLNLIESHVSNILACFQQVDNLVQIPLLLPYLQHCKFLLIVFALTYPLTVSLRAGFWANVLNPWLLFIALVGFEKLAERLENPVGDDDTDLNVLEMIHWLEVSASHVFEVSECNKMEMRRSLARPLTAATKEALPAFPPNGKLNGSQSRPFKAFSKYFTWIPMPLQTIEYILEKQGHIATVHSVRWVEYASSWVRRTSKREKKQDVDSQSSYHSIPNVEAGPDPVKAPKKTIKALSQDRFAWHHHLCLRDHQERQNQVTTECSKKLRHYCTDMRSAAKGASSSVREARASVTGANTEDEISTTQTKRCRTWYLNSSNS